MKYLYLLYTALFFMSCSDSKKQNTFETTIAKEKEKTAIDYSLFVDRDFIIDDQHSYIGFKINYFGFSPVRGRFNEFSGTVFYEPSMPSTTRMTLKIPVNSINTGNDTRDTDLITGDSWFHEKKFPFILFETTSAEATNEGGITLSGNFTMNGVTKEIQIPFQKPTKISRDWAANQQVDYTATLSLNRKDYNIEGGDFWDTMLEDGVTQLSDNVTIELDIHTRRPDYEQRYVETDSTDIRKMILDEIKLSGIQNGINLIAESDEISAGALITIARTLLVWQMNDEAITVLQKSISKFPDKLNFYNLMGIASLKQKEYNKSRQYFEMVLAKDPNNTKAHAYKQLIDQID